jgi:hypothetical protein
MSGIRRSDDKRAPGAVVDDQEDCSDVMSRLSSFAKGWGRIPTLFLFKANGLRNPAVEGWDA